MKKLFCVVWALALLGLTAGPVLVQAAEDKPKKPRKEKPDRPKKGKSGVRGEYAIMASVLKLTDDQKAKLEALIKEMNGAVRTDMEASKEKAAEIKKEMEAAKKAKDKAAGQAARKKMTELKKSSLAIKAGFQKKILELMTAEQRGKWGGFGLYRRICRTFAKAKLTDDQKKAVRPLCDAAAKELGDVAISTAREDKKEIAAALKKLGGKITTDILTNEQVEGMKKKAKPNADKKKPGDKKNPGDKKDRKKKGAEGNV